MAKKGKKSRPRMTPKGKMVLQLSVLLIGGGIYWESAPVVQIGFFLVALVLTSFFMCWKNFSEVELHREMPDSVFSGTEFYVYVSVRKQGLNPVHCLSVKDMFLPEKKSHMLVAVVNDVWQKCTAVKMKLSKRGMYKDAFFRISSDFPLGFFKMEKKLKAKAGITVFPEPVQPNEGFQLFHGQDNEVERDFCAGRYSYGSFRGLREFVPGDPLKLVSWSVSARSENLMVRDLEPPEPERYTIIFHAVKIKKYMPDSKQFERCLKLLSGLFMFLQENNLSFEFYSSINNWVPFVCDNPLEPPIAPLMVLAQAKFGNPDQLADLTDVISNVPADYHCIVLGATKLEGWQSKVPESACSMTLMDSKNIEHVTQVFG